MGRCRTVDHIGRAKVTPLEPGARNATSEVSPRAAIGRLKQRTRIGSHGNRSPLMSGFRKTIPKPIRAPTIAPQSPPQMKRVALEGAPSMFISTAPSQLVQVRGPPPKVGGVQVV